jgi:PRC-barrel domain
VVVDREIGPDPFAALKSGSEEYHVYDRHYERIGRVDDVFIDERDAASYIGVKMGFFGTNSTLVPVEIVRVNDLRRLIEVDEDAETIKHAPHFGHDETVSPELEDRVRTYFGLEPLLSPQTPAETYPPEDTGHFGPDSRVDTEPGERIEDQERIAGQPAQAPRAGASSDATPEDRWDRESREGGVVVHRRRG